MTTLKIAELLEQNYSNEIFKNNEINQLKEEIESDSFINELLELSDSPLHNTFEVENLLTKTTSLLNMLIEKREDLKNMEVVLYGQVLSKILKKIKNKNEKDNNNVEKKYEVFLGAVLKNNSTIQIEDNIIKANDASIEKSINYKSEQLQIKNNTLLEIEAIDDLYEEFKQLKDSGINFLDRYLENREIYRTIFREFFLLCNSLEIGVKSVYGLNFERPSIKSSSLLNKYYLWLKKITFELDKLLKNEQEVELIISLKQGVFDSNGFIANSKIENFDAQRDGGTFTFRLPNAIMNDKRFIRIRNIDIQFDAGDHNYRLWWDNEVFPVSVKLPEQVKFDGEAFPIPTLKINATNYQKNSQTYKTQANFIHNCNPFSNDSWQITIPTRGALHKNQDISRNTLLDVYLILRLAFISQH